MKRIALVTCSEFLELSASDQLLMGPLTREGFAPVATAWDDPSVAWNEFSAIILRSTWNYHYMYEPFISWLTRMELLRIPLWNPPSVVRWNSQKTYLRDLSAKGIRTIPTQYIPRNCAFDLSLYMNSLPFNEAVIKPTIGASAYGVISVSKGNEKFGQRNLNALLEKTDCMIQPLINSVRTQGEYSSVFIGGTYSHTVLKTPPKGEFRSNFQFGSKEVLMRPDAQLIRDAATVLSAVEDKTLYARVDSIRDAEGFMLMELELIEPHLFFDFYPKGAEQFARAVTHMI